MRTRLTPLNIIAAILLFSVCYLLLFPDETGWRKLGILPLAVFLALALVCDLVFRALLRDLKRIWLIELLFIIFVVVFVYILNN